eukprot:CCRYP_020035-RA/>CCRYP_020035-RA protein AED:0.09 eAED:0.09 QI:0/-1/0/1/-1/0/1/0/79
MYMELPKGIETRHGSSKDHVLMLLSNLYGQKQAGCVWNSYLVEKLCNIGAEHSKYVDVDNWVITKLWLVYASPFGIVIR